MLDPSNRDCIYMTLTPDHKLHHWHRHSVVDIPIQTSPMNILETQKYTCMLHQKAIYIALRQCWQPLLLTYYE